jgi:ABC-type oligopeptide transport system substrate-binding subunit
MVRRFLCLAALLLLTVMCVPACDSSSKTKKENIVTDPDKVAPPKPGGAKAG